MPNYSISLLFGIFAGKKENEMAKVIHVHLLKRGRFERKDYYFASISAIYTVLTAEDVGVTKNYLLHAGLSGNGSVATKCAMIQQSTLIRCKRQTEGGKKAS